MNKKENYPEHSSSVNNENASREQKYIEENLWYYIQNSDRDKRFSNERYGWIISYSHDTKVQTVLLDYILEHFTLWELYTLFYEHQDPYYLNEVAFREAKQNAIGNINSNSTLTIQEKMRLKRKIWDMNPVIFGLIHELIYKSDLFWDAKNEKEVYPDFS